MNDDPIDQRIRELERKVDRIIEILGQQGAVLDGAERIPHERRRETVVATEERDFERLDDPLLLSVAEACHRLGLAASTGHRMIRDGEFPVSVRRIGTRMKVSRFELEEWLRKPVTNDEDR